MTIQRITVNGVKYMGILEVRTDSLDHELGRYSKSLYCIKHLRGTGVFVMDQILKAYYKDMNNSESRESASISCNTVSRKRSRKGKNPTRFTLTTEEPSDFVSPTTWLCRNSTCRAVLSMDVAFCRQCSCCICHQYDDNKDPSLWLGCESESGQDDSCGASCHIECAFQQKKLGVVNLGQYMHLDGSYCCSACGKVSGIVGCWKEQLAVAKDARHVDVLYYRLNLSYRLLHGTARFKDLDDIITEAKTKLEAEVDPMIGDSVEMSKSIVSMLDSAGDVHRLCSLAIDKANELLANDSTVSLNGKRDSLPVACRFLFEEVTSSSLVIVLIDIPVPIVDSIIGYKLWFCKSQGELFSNEPSSIFTREKKRITVGHLQPCTEYTFRIIAYTEAGDLGHSEAKCYNKSVEVLNKDTSSAGHKKDHPSLKDHPNSNFGASCSRFNARDLEKSLHIAWVQEQGCGVTEYDVPPEIHQPSPVSLELDLNVVSIPDLNDLPPPLESSRDEDLEWTLERAAGLDDDVASHGVEKNGDTPAVDSLAETRRKRASSVNEETPIDDNALFNSSPVRINGPGSRGQGFSFTSTP